MKKGKKYLEAAKKYDKQTQYTPAEALGKVIEMAPAKFDETVEVHVRLGVDGRHADQQVRGAIVLPHGTGKTVRVLVFAKGDKAKQKPPALITSVPRTWCRRSSRKAGSISTLSSLPRI